MKKTYSYLKAIVICHGKSEKQICEYIKSNLRLKIDVYSDKKGGKSIQITSLKKILDNSVFGSFKGFLRYYDDVEICITEKKKTLNNQFKIFIIMDTDDCKTHEKRDYINKTMFRNHWAYDFIVPLYNCPELESVLTKSKIPFQKKGSEKKKEYIKIFPTDVKYQKNECIQLKEFADTLSVNTDTNLEQFIYFCLDL